MLETLVTFIGAVLLLALVSQSLLEAVKTAIPIQAMTRMGSAKALLEETARSEGLTTADGHAMYRAVADRLRGLGQSGWVGVRLDRLSAHDLSLLIKSIRHDAIPGLRACEDKEKRLQELADRASGWFEMAMAPVADRYHRRMRVTNIVAAVVVVLALNVNAIALMERARSDPDFRESVQGRVALVDSILGESEALAARVNELEQGGDAAAPAATPADVEAVRARLDSAAVELAEIAQGSVALFDTNEPRRWGDPDWWVGILLSVFLVSLGAPFWHDLLGSLLGIKKRLQSPVPARQAREDEDAPEDGSRQSGRGGQ